MSGRRISLRGVYEISVTAMLQRANSAILWENNCKEVGASATSIYLLWK